MEDIARMCGVTKMTVSRVLGGHANVRKITRDKVLAAASHLEYEPNLLAKSLSANRSSFIGLATPFAGFLASDYFGWILYGCAPVLREAGMGFALFDTEAALSNDGRKLATLYRQRRVDGLLITAVQASHRFLDDPMLRRVPMVMIGEKPPRADVSAVFCNEYGGIHSLCAHLYELGHRRIGFVTGLRDLSRRQSYEDFCRERDLGLPAAYLQQGDYSIGSGRQAGLTLLQLRARPTAIVTANDTMAFGVLQSAMQLGLRVPQDVSVGGFDDLGMAASWYPALTSVSQPVAEMSCRGAEMLLAGLNSHSLPTEQIMFDVELAVRDTTAPPGPSKARKVC